MTLVSPRRWASGDDEPSASRWDRRPADELFSELLDELAAELLADEQWIEPSPAHDAPTTAEDNTSSDNTAADKAEIDGTEIDKAEIDGADNLSSAGSDKGGDSVDASGNHQGGADAVPTTLVDADRVELVPNAAQPASQIFVDDQRRGRRVVSIMLTTLKLAVMIYAAVVAFGFVDLLGL